MQWYVKDEGGHYRHATGYIRTPAGVYRYVPADGNWVPVEDPSGIDPALIQDQTLGV